MASALTSTNLKSSSLYFLFLVLIMVGVFYLFIFKKPEVSEGLQMQAFRLNAAAFTNGIHLANVRFLASSTQNQLVDLWVDKNIGLDYNAAGYPIGTDLAGGTQNTPQTVENCMQVWRFVLGPLKPKLTSFPIKDGYWVELENDNTCVYRGFNLKKMQLSYQSITGKVLLTE